MKKLSAYATFSVSLLLSFLLFSLLLCACAKPSLPPDYRRQGFQAELLWQESSVSLHATLVAEAPHQEDDLGRTVTLTFHAPDTLADIVLTVRDGTATVGYGDCVTDGSHLTAWIAAATLPITDGVMRPIGMTAENGVELFCAEIQSADATQACCVYLDPTTGFPQRIESSTQTVTVLSFTPLS